MYKSDEEEIFAEWLGELKNKGLVLSYEYEPDPFVLCDKVDVNYLKQLKTKTKDQSINLLQELVYTTDFKIQWSDTADGLLTYQEGKVYNNNPRKLILNKNGVSYVEIKPSFDFQNMTRYVKIKIAWVYSKYNIYIPVIDPYKLFRETFYPDKYKYTKNGKSLRRKKINGKMYYVKDVFTFYDDFVSSRETISKT